MFNSKKEMERRIGRLEREITNWSIHFNNIQTEFINLQMVVKKVKDITGYDSYEYKTELVKKDIPPKEMTATEAMAEKNKK